MQLNISVVLQLQEGGNLKQIIHCNQDICTMPAADHGAFFHGSGGSRPRSHSVSSPCPERRRVIFPSLHDASPSQQPKPGYQLPRQIKKQNDFVDVTARNASPKSEDDTFKPLLRSSSLDGVPLPKPAIVEGTSSDKDATSPMPLINQRTKSPAPLTNVPSAPRGKWIPPSSVGLSSFEEKSAKSPIFGDVVRHKTYYPAASAPTPLHEKSNKPSSHFKPRASILRGKAASSTTASQLRPQKLDETPAGERTSVAAPQSTLAALTLASPASIKSLRGKPREKESEGKDGGIGESEYNLERLSPAPKVISRMRNIPRNHSDTTVSKTEEEGGLRDSFTSSSQASSVSRHASLECLPSNKKISFDPHVTVYEFGTTNYEKKGGEKWFSADELTQFKKEAMQRIRLRSMKTLIPTGTGRTLSIHPKEKAKLDEKTSQGVVSFNHPALGCEEDLDLESPSPKVSSPKHSLQDPAAAAHIKNVLVVDSHEVFLALFTKSLKHMVPHACVATARSSEEAMTRIEAARKAFPIRDGGSTHGFDIIIIEERLHVLPSARGGHTSLQRSISMQTGGEDSDQRMTLSSGSALIRYLVGSEQEGSGTSIRHSLLIGVSARLAQDKEKIKMSGADCVWGKPPPEMNKNLRNKLLKLLMKKRNSK